MRGRCAGLVVATALTAAFAGACSSGDDATPRRSSPAPATTAPTTTAAPSSPAPTPKETSTKVAKKGFGGWTKKGIARALVRTGGGSGVTGYAPAGRPKVTVDRVEENRAAEVEDDRCREQAEALDRATRDVLTATASYVADDGAPLPVLTETITAWDSVGQMRTANERGAALDDCLGRTGGADRRTVAGVSVETVTDTSPAGWSVARFTVGSAMATVLCSADSERSAPSCDKALRSAVKRLKSTKPR